MRLVPCVAVSSIVAEIGIGNELSVLFGTF